MNLNKKDITEKIREIVEDLGYLFIGIDFRGDSRNHILEIYIDNEIGITIVNCSDVSKMIAEMLENENLIGSRYRLDVSSPGLDRPLKYIQQFKKNIGRSFELLLEGDENTKLKGDLIEVNNDELKFKIEKELKEINIKNIRSAKVVVRF